jgi:catechol 2,3-dioxygenase-like lactoylglutathione lyase family enzyme
VVGARRPSEHPIGLTGLSHFSVAVADHRAALNFYRNALDAETVVEEERRSIAARVTRLRLADSRIDLMSRLGTAGPINDHLYRYGDGVRSVVFGVTDLDRAATQLSAWGCPIQSGDDDETLAIAPEWNCGVMMELTAGQG